jgi:pyruvate-formate lyase-activating enzyme
MRITVTTKIYKLDDKVLSCKKLESGLRFGQEGVAACALGPFQSPIYWTPNEINKIKFSKDIIIQRRKEVFDILNDPDISTPCKTCNMVYKTTYGEIDFSKLGHIDYSAASYCNLRCNYCWYTTTDNFKKASYNSLDILNVFEANDVLWDSAVDFGGGEPTLLDNFNRSIEYFKSRKIRVFLYTNSVKFSQKAYDRLKDGTISWICTSLDCGTSSTYKKMKQKNHFNDVILTLTKYAKASREGDGNLSVKYIFTNDNCSDDDIYGFAYAMSTLKPDKVWLTVDFEPLKGLDQTSNDFGSLNDEKIVASYAKLYLKLISLNIDTGHYLENHLSQVNKQGNILLQRVQCAIREKETELGINKNESEILLDQNKPYFKTDPIMIKYPNKDFLPWNFKNKNVLIVPACNLAIELSKEKFLSQNNFLGFVDRNPTLQGKTIEEKPVFSYSEIKNLNPDIILIASHKQHIDSIYETITKSVQNDTLKVVMI